jgi:transposase InsO family protein
VSTPAGVGHFGVVNPKNGSVAHSGGCHIASCRCGAIEPFPRNCGWVGRRMWLTLSALCGAGVAYEDAGRAARPAPNLVKRNFVAAAHDQLWVADITYIPTWSGFLHLSVVVDAWSRRRRPKLPLESRALARPRRRDNASMS